MRTGKFLEASAFADEINPITFGSLNETNHPVLIGDNDEVHFFDVDTILRCIDHQDRTLHPLTNEPFTIHDVQALLTSATQDLYDYVYTLRKLALNGNCEARRLDEDLQAWAALRGRPAGWVRLFKEYVREEIDKWFQFANYEDPAILRFPGVAYLSDQQRTALLTTQLVRKYASNVVDADESIAAKGRLRRLKRETLGVSLFKARLPLPWPMGLPKKQGEEEQQSQPYTEEETDIADRFVTLRWASCRGRADQSFGCRRMAHELLYIIRKVLNTDAGNRYQGSLERALKLLEDRLPIHCKAVVTEEGNEILVPTEPRRFVVWSTSPINQLRIAIGRLSTADRERLAAEEHTLSEWVRLLLPLGGRDPNWINMMDYGTRTYVDAIRYNPEIGRCFQGDWQRWRFVPSAIAFRVRDGGPGMSVHDDASMDEEEVRQTVRAPSVGDAPFYFNLRTLEAQELDVRRHPP